MILQIIVLLALCSLASLAEIVTISKSEDFVRLVQRASDGPFQFDIRLETDLDFSDEILRSVVGKLPLGYTSDEKYFAYSGIFDGKGYSVKNLKQDNNGRKYSGFFFDVEEAHIKNLIIDESCVFKGENVGVLSVFVSGNVNVQNVKVFASTNLQNFGGGLIGRSRSLNDKSVFISSCVFQGNVVLDVNKADSFFGGYIGCLSDSYDIHVELQHNINNGTIVSNLGHGAYVGGYIGKVHDNTQVILNISDNSNFMKMNAILPDNSESSIGGYIGGVVDTDATIEMKNNVNKIVFNVSRGEMVSVGGYIGSISNNIISLSMENNENDGFVQLFGNGAFTWASGYIGHVTECCVDAIEFKSNINNVNIHGEFDYSGSVYISGFTGEFKPSTTTESKRLRFDGNINNGFMSVSGSYIYEAFFGGMIGSLITSEMNGDETLSALLSRNTNNGDIHLQFQSGKLSVGGLLGLFFDDHLCWLEANDNTNNGWIEGLFHGDSLNVGGVTGALQSFGNVDILLSGNTNNGMINISDPDGSYGSTFVAGLFGVAAMSTNVNIYDSANYGHVINDVDAPLSFTCGIICGADDLSAHFYIYNCVNNAPIQGKFVFGITTFLTDGDIIVNNGDAIGVIDSYSFWYSLFSNVASVYGLDGACINCNDDVSLFRKDNNDGQYYTTEGDDLVYELLNQELELKCYNLIWSPYLYLRRPITIRMNILFNLDIDDLGGLPLKEYGLPNEIFNYHLMREGPIPRADKEILPSTFIVDDVILVPCYMVTINGELNATVYVKSDNQHILHGVMMLKKYVDNNITYAVRNVDDNMMVNGETIVTRDMNLFVTVLYHTITISGELNATIRVRADASATLGGKVEMLNRYFDGNEYVVGDLERKTLCSKDTPITGDMRIIVMERHVITNEIEEKIIHRDDIDESVIAQIISDVYGVKLDIILVEIEVDDEGYVTSMSVILNEEEVTDSLASAIQDCVTS